MPGPISPIVIVIAIVIVNVIVIVIVIVIFHSQVVIAWIYLSLDDTPAPDKNYNWKFLEDPFA